MENCDIKLYIMIFMLVNLFIYNLRIALWKYYGLNLAFAVLFIYNQSNRFYC